MEQQKYTNRPTNEISFPIEVNLMGEGTGTTRIATRFKWMRSYGSVNQIFSKVAIDLKGKVRLCLRA